MRTTLLGLAIGLTMLLLCSAAPVVVAGTPPDPPPTSTTHYLPLIPHAPVPEASSVMETVLMASDFYAVQGDFLVAARGEEISTYTIHPAYPFGYTPPGTLRFPHQIQIARVAGDRLVLAYDFSGLAVVDISDRQNPFIRSRMAGDRAIFDMITDGNLVYVSMEEGFAIWDLSAPGHPQRVGALPTLWQGEIERYSDEILRVGAAFVDVSDPSHPEVVGQLPQNAWGNRIENGARTARQITQQSEAQRLYLLESSCFKGWCDTWVEIFDIADPTQPQQLSRYTTTDHDRAGTGLVVADETIYLAKAYDRIEIIDISSPQTPVYIMDFDLSTAGVTSDNPFLADANTLIVGEMPLASIDITARHAPIVRSTLPLDHPMTRPVHDGPNLYYRLVDRTAPGLTQVQGLNVFSLSQPGQILFLGWMEISAPHPGVSVFEVQESPALMAAMIEHQYSEPMMAQTSVLLLDADGPNHPAVLAEVTNQDVGGVWGYQLFDDMLYVNSGYGSLEVYDVADPAAPSRLDRQQFDSGLHKWARVGDRGYALVWAYDGETPDSYHGLRIYTDLATNPMPQEIPGATSHPLGMGYVQDWALADPARITLGSQTQLKLIDATVSTAPQVLGVYSVTMPLENETVAAWAFGDGLAVAGGSRGSVLLVDITDADNITVTATYSAPFGIVDLDMEANRLFVAYGRSYTSGIPQGVLALDLSDPSQPQLLDSLNISPIWVRAQPDGTAYVGHSIATGFSRFRPGSPGLPPYEERAIAQ